MGDDEMASRWVLAATLAGGVASAAAAGSSTPAEPDEGGAGQGQLVSLAFDLYARLRSRDRQCLLLLVQYLERPSP